MNSRKDDATLALEKLTESFSFSAEAAVELVHLGADVNKKNKYGLTPFEMIFYNSKIPIEELRNLLKKYKPDFKPISENQLKPYQAPKPKVPQKIRLWKLVHRLLFPPILFWDSLKWLANKLNLGKVLGQLIFQAQNEINRDNKEELEVAQWRNERLIFGINLTTQLTAEKFLVATHDGALLDSVELSPPNTNQSSESYLINFFGSAQSYESRMDEMMRDAQVLQAKVIGFNLRGAILSSGKAKSQHDLVVDGIAQVQRLLDKGVDPEKIYLKGFSLGAGIAPFVALHFYDLDLKINLFDGNSFSSLTNLLVGWLRTLKLNLDEHSGHLETWPKKLLGWILKPLIYFILTLAQWNMNAASAYKALPSTHKEYMVARSSKKDREKFGSSLKDDAMITHYGSLHLALKAERRAEKSKINQQTLKLLGNDCKKFSPAEIKEKLKEARAHLKRRKMVADNKNEDAHGEDMDKLKDRYQGKSANEFFWNFYKQSELRHAKKSICHLDLENRVIKNII